MIRLTDHLGQLRRNGINAGDGCGGDGGDDYFTESNAPPASAPDVVTATPSCGGGGEGGSESEDYTCEWTWVTFQISRDGGKTWEGWWSGWAQVCEENAS